MKITLFVAGIPKGQPRARAFSRGGMVRMYDPGTADAWKQCITIEWKRYAQNYKKIVGPCALDLTFKMPRPKSHYTKKGLKPESPIWFDHKPDADNLAKAVMDCLTDIGVWEDDDQVVHLSVQKAYAEGDDTGCWISIWKKI